MCRHTADCRQVLHYEVWKRSGPSFRKRGASIVVITRVRKPKGAVSDQAEMQILALPFSCGGYASQRSRTSEVCKNISIQQGVDSSGIASRRMLPRRTDATFMIKILTTRDLAKRDTIKWRGTDTVEIRMAAIKCRLCGMTSHHP